MTSVTVTYLEMLERPEGPDPELLPGLTVLQVREPSTRFYRYLYDSVGQAWRWVDRHSLDDEQLLRELRRPGTEVHVLYRGGVPAGYCELVRAPADVKIQYFGLMPECIGLGLGGFWLRWTVAQAWASRPQRVWLHTCTLDHPRALPLYQKVGFTPYRVDVVEVTVGQPG